LREKSVFCDQIKEERGNDASLDSVDSVPSFLSFEGKIEKHSLIIHQFYFSNKDNAFSTGFTL
jgi:hypothetical protein